MKEIGIGIVGFGTVGAGVVEGLLTEGGLIAERSGTCISLKGVADLDITTDRGFAVPEGILTTDTMGLIHRPDVQIIVELIGGTGFARTVIETALKAGKSVVTANKKLLAECGPSLFRLASENNCDLYFGASVGGGIPIIRALRDGLVGNRIDSIHGILNGTCNYILTRMELEGLPFDEILADAQRLGYAEVNPSLDIDGYDTAHKIAILASLAYGLRVPMEEVLIEGIRGLSDIDVRYATALGYRIKLLAICKCIDSELEIRVHPTLVPLTHMLASVANVFNAAMVDGSLTGDTLYYGRGAGRAATASTVIGDIVSVARHLAVGTTRAIQPLREEPQAGYTIRSKEACVSRFYIRLMVKDKAGMVGRFATILGNNGVSMTAASQHEMSEEEQRQGFVPVVILTHACPTGAVIKALKEIQEAGIVEGTPLYLRIL